MKEIETFQEPENYSYSNIMFWEPLSKELMFQRKVGNASAGSLLTKARNFLEHDCIYQKEGKWFCKPIKDYNTKTYIIENTISNKWCCNCQGFTSKIERGEEGICSHIVAVKQMIFIESKRKVKRNGLFD